MTKKFISVLLLTTIILSALGVSMPTISYAAITSKACDGSQDLSFSKPGKASYEKIVLSSGIKSGDTVYKLTPASEVADNRALPNGYITDADICTTWIETDFMLDNDIAFINVYAAIGKDLLDKNGNKSKNDYTYFPMMKISTTGGIEVKNQVCNSNMIFSDGSGISSNSSKKLSDVSKNEWHKIRITTLKSSNKLKINFDDAVYTIPYNETGDLAKYGMKFFNFCAVDNRAGVTERESVYFDNLKYMTAHMNATQAEKNTVEGSKYINDLKHAMILKEINACLDASGIGVALNDADNKTAFSYVGLRDIDYEADEYEYLRDELYLGLPYSTSTALVEKINIIIDAYDAINNVTEATVTACLTNYESILLEDGQLESYNSSTELKKTLINQMVVSNKPYNKISDFKEFFATQFSNEGTPAEPGESTDKLISDFTDGSLSGWSSNTSAHSLLAIETPSFAGGNSLAHYTIADPGSNHQMGYALSGEDMDLTKYDGIYLTLYSPSVTSYNFGVVLYAGDNESGKWKSAHKLINLDFAGWNTIYLPIDNMTMQRDPDLSQVQKIVISSNGYSANISEDMNFYIEKIWLGNDGELTPSVTNASVTSGQKLDMGSVITYKFNTSDIYTCLDSVKIEKKNGTGGYDDIENVTFSLSGDTLTLPVGGNITSAGDYKITLQNIFAKGGNSISEYVTNVTIEEKDIYISDFVSSTSVLPASGSVISAVEIANEGSSDADFSLVMAVYDENNRMTSYDMKTETATAGSDAVISAVVSESSYENSRIRSFVLNADANNQPISSRVIDIAAAAPVSSVSVASVASLTRVAASSGELVVSDMKVSGDNIRLKGSTNQNSIVPVSVMVYNPNGTLCHIAQVDSLADGSFTYDFTLSPFLDMAGVYTAKLASMAMINTSMPDVSAYFADNTVRNTVKSNINSATSSFDMANKLNTYITELQIDNVNYTTADYVYLAEAIYENKPYSDFYEILDVYNTAKTVLASLNSKDWTNYSSIILGNTKLVLNGHADRSYYTALGTSAQSQVNNLIINYLPVDGFVEFRTAFGKAVADYKNSLIVTSQDKKDNVVGGYTSSGPSGSGGQVTPPAPVVPVTIFDDIISVPWAETAINELAKKGVLSQPADKKFRPNDNVTREEFIKMLIIALGLNNEIAENSTFTDVDLNAWYAPYINVAYKLGITSGYPDGSFGIGDYITREDLSTLAYRAVNGEEAANISAFADDYDIADYAKSAVYAMRALGIIDGVGDNLFMPKATATRAQAAKIIYGLINAEVK